MHRIDSSGSVGGMWTDGQPGDTEATLISEDWMNAVQEELVELVVNLPTAAAGTLVKADNTQVRTALIATFGRLAAANTWTAANAFSGDVSVDGVVTQERAVISDEASLLLEFPNTYDLSGTPTVQSVGIYRLGVASNLTGGVHPAIAMAVGAAWSGSAWTRASAAVPASLTVFASDGVRILTAPSGSVSWTGAQWAGPLFLSATTADLGLEINAGRAIHPFGTSNTVIIKAAWAGAPAGTNEVGYWLQFPAEYGTPPTVSISGTPGSGEANVASITFANTTTTGTFILATPSVADTFTRFERNVTISP